jgi:protoporphyrinogen oxidase
MSHPHVIILGGGPAGVGAAYKLAQTGRFQVTLLEQAERVGGNAGSFELVDPRATLGIGLRVDFGSHRLHPACDPEILADIRNLLGDDLLDRPRHGRIFLKRHWIYFPLKPLNLVLHLPPSFSFHFASDLVGKVIRRFNIRTTEPNTVDTFASVMEHGLGRTICQEFYFPYARKIWGVDPSLLSAVQARRRVSAGSLVKMMQKILSAIPGLRPKGTGRFYYPRQGFGQISEAYAAAAKALGADIHLGTRVTRIELQPDQVMVHSGVSTIESLHADYVWSTIPITTLARLIEPAAPAEILQAATTIDYRAMLLIYLVLEQDRFTEYDAHYFPDPEIHITRLSEPKNYSGSSLPHGCTVLCAELPCNPGEREWQLSDEALGNLVQEDLTRAGLAIHAPIRQVLVRRLKYAYPIYLQGYETHFNSLDEWLSQHERLLTFGRQGLFAHDNTHHALFMAYSAVDCFQPDGFFDHQRWKEFRKVFETHVVED